MRLWDPINDENAGCQNATTYVLMFYALLFHYLCTLLFELFGVVELLLYRF